jgi:hypothetical protein
MPKKITSERKEIQSMIEHEIYRATKAGQNFNSFDVIQENRYLGPAPNGSGNSAGVTSVGFTAPAQFTITNSPITSTGTINMAWTANVPENYVLSGPATGAGAGVPTFKALSTITQPDTNGTPLNQAIIKYIHNDSGVAFNKGQAVYVVGSQGTRLTVALADASTETTAATTIGVCMSNIPINGDGFIICQGMLTGLDTNHLTEGYNLWLSETPGEITVTRPTAPAHGVALGWCVKQGPGSSGMLYIKVINGQELEELHDVNISTPLQNHILYYDATTSIWRNQLGTNLFAAASHTHAIADVTGLQTALNGKEPTITAGTTSQYWRGDKSWQTLNTTAVTEGTNLYFTEARVRSTVLTGYSAGTNTALAATDSLLTAFGKVQGQITARSTRADSTNSVIASDTRAVNEAPQDRGAGIYFDFKQNTTTGLSDTGTYHGMVTFRPYASGTDFSGGPSHRLAFSNSGRLYRQNSTNATTWSSWVRILDTATITASDIPSGSTSYIQNQSASAQSATFNVANDVTVNSMTIGRGGGNVSGNTAVGASAIAATATGSLNSAFGMGALQSLTSGNSNTAIGYGAGNLITTTSNNTAIGNRSMEFSTGVSNNTGVGQSTLRYVVGSENVAVGRAAYPGVVGGTSTGTDNTAIGNDTLTSNTSGSQNTVIGNSAMYFNTTGSQNVAIGHFSLYNATTRSANVAIGREALRYVDIDFQTAIGTAALRGSTTVANNTGTNNSAIGYFALSANTSGSSNTAIGRSTMPVNTTGSDNTAVGRATLNSNDTGSRNTAIGLNALWTNTSGADNTAIGLNAGFSSATVNSGTYIGAYAGRYIINGFQTAIGFEALQGNSTTANNTGTQNLAIGYRALRLNSSGSNNLAIGLNTMANHTTGSHNIAIGTAAMQNNLTSGQNVAIGVSSQFTNNSATGSNTSVGYQSLYSNNGGDRIVAIGHNALFSNTTGNFNVAIGVTALFSNTTASSNVAVGMQAMQYIATGDLSVAVGSGALRGNVNTALNTGVQNVAVGHSTLASNTSGTGNAGMGSYCLTNNTSGYYNLAIGNQALLNNTTGFQNTCVGHNSANSNTTGNNNVSIGAEAYQYYIGSSQVAIGYQALRGSTTVANNTGIQNTAVGHNTLTANTSGSDNTALGYQAGNTNTTGSDNTYIGLDAKGLATGNWQIAIGSGVQPTASNLGAWGGSTNATRTDLGIGIFTPTARLHVATLAVGNKGLIVDGIASQTANLVEVNATTGGTNYVTVNSGGAVSMSRRATTGIATLTDGATISLDASLGNHFRVTLGGNRTLAAPTNPTDGQRIMIEVIQDGTGGRTLALTTGTNGFAFGTDITGITLSTAIGARDFIGAVYNSTAQRWYVIAFVKGY